MRSDRSNPLQRAFSRRAFFGATGALAAGALLPKAQGLSVPRFSPVIDDYVGRLCYNENPLGPSPLAKAVMTEQLDLAHRYGDWMGESLREELRNLHGVLFNQVIAGAGGTEMLHLAAHAFADPNGNVVCPYPSYGGFDSDAALYGAEVRHSDLDSNYRVDLDDVLAHVDDQTSAVCITNPNNPTGTVLPASDLAAFADALPAKAVLIIDEAYHYFVHDPLYSSAIDLVLQDKNVVIIRTFSKAHGLAGIRIGYAVGKGSLMNEMARWQFWGTVSRIACEGAIAALGDSQHVNNSVALADNAKQLCYNRFDFMGLDYIPSETNFFMVDVDRNASEVAGELASRGIYVRVGWGMSQHLRVSVGRLEEMQTFLTALGEILGTDVDELPPPRVTMLDGNFPNPFHDKTRITYRLAQDLDVRLELFDAQGRLIRTLQNARQGRGRHVFEWDGSDASGRSQPPGIYYYRLTAGDKIQTRRVIRIR